MNQPIAWMYVDNVGTHYTDCKSDWYDAPGIEEVTPLYAKREWVGLTDEEVGMLSVFDGLHHIETPLLANFIRAIEAKLKGKNT